MHFKITLPSEVALAPAIRQIAERVAQCAGYSAAEAARLASGVGQAADAVFSRAGIARSDVDVRFEREGNYLDVWLRYEAPEENRAAVVDPALSSEVLRLGLDSIEFGRDDGLAYCHLRRALPHEKTDPQCDLPPGGHKA